MISFKHLRLVFYLHTFSLATATLGQEGTFSFASYYGNHMVLQRGPQRAIVWGYSPQLGDAVTVSVGASVVKTTVVSGQVTSGGVWSVKLPAITEPGPFNINASSSHGNIYITDVLFGDVWICSGQSNMQVTVSMTFNATAEIADADNYPNIRVMTVGNKASSSRETDLTSIRQHWSVASSASIGGSDWNYFSALCWYYGKYVHRHRGYPMGLIDSNWGATKIQPWMSPRGLEKCDIHVNSTIVLATPAPGQFYYPDEATATWNSMIAPLTKMTIYGAIWYQGESNAGNPETYKCLFPAMINDWREQFHNGSGGETDATFPFGFAQLAPNRKQDVIGGFPELRWKQTADFGYVPNSLMKKVFMAVAMDLPDFDSPLGSIHPRNKQDIALRLGLGAEAMAYGVKDTSFQGPFPTTLAVNPATRRVNIEFDNGRTPIDVRGQDGFEVCCSTNVGAACAPHDAEWKAAPIVVHQTSGLDLDYRKSCGPTDYVLGIRYAWRESPCAVKRCAVYSKQSGLPAPIYISLGYYG